MSVDYSETIEIDAGDEVKATAFTTNGEYLVSGGGEGVQVWRVKDGARVAAMKVEYPGIWSVAVSKDGRYIAGESPYAALVWDTANYEQVFVGSGRSIRGIDFSPDSTRLVTADGGENTATVWDILTRQKAHTLDHGKWVEAAKYSPLSPQIATATRESVRVWDSGGGQLLVDIKVGMESLWCGLVWFNNYLFVKTEHKIKQVDASTGLTASEWSVPDHYYASISLAHHGKFIAYSTNDNITFWDTSTHAKLGLVSQSNDGCSIAFSPDDHLLAVGQARKIIIRGRSRIKGPEIQIDSVALDAWKHDDLANAEAILSAAILTSTDTAHHLFASRALIRARLRQWDAALVDAEESIRIQSSVIGDIAKCVALVGKGDTHAGCRVSDIASLRFHSDHVGALLLIKAVVLFMAGEHDDAISRIADLLRVAYLDSKLCMIQAYMHLLLGNLHMDRGDFERAIQSFSHARIKIGDRRDQPPLTVSLISGWRFDNLAITIQQRLCEALFAAGRTREAGESVLRMVDQEVDMTKSTKAWVSDFMQRCLSTPEQEDSPSSVTACCNDSSHPMTLLLRGWARLRLTTESWEDILASTTGFIFPRFTIYQVICEHLEMSGSVEDAVSCFHQMHGELGQEMDREPENWTQDFKLRCRDELEDCGDRSMQRKEYDEAISQYTIALSLDPAKQDLLIKRSMAHLEKGEWDDALNDANEVIRLDPNSPLGYERKHATLHRKGIYDGAIGAYETMLLKISQSSDPKIREWSRRYVRPEDKRAAIHATIQDTIRDSPPVLIHTIDGCLCNKSEQASTFEKTQTFKKLVSSMTTHIDHAHIMEEVQKYFRYATFSHKWEDNEPLFEKVIKVVVYDLEASTTHEKLQMFCKVVREAGFNWAWSDTCCIDKGDHFVLQEALVSMFRWYEGSAMTIIFLRGVNRLAKRGALMRSIWNMRAWTLQEYHASKVVQFYTEDWTPYLGLEICNHKESPEIISEMEDATGISAQALMALRPGLNDIREKLQLASTRKTTRVEDAAYSLLGIFSLSLPITYGEGDQALGRLLAQLLTSSGDTSILAWTGRSGGFNSCLPSSISVFRDPPTSHIPVSVSDAAVIRPLNLALLTKLYDQVNELGLPSFSGQRMKLPCLAFKLGQVAVSRRPERFFRAQTKGLGIVEIHTQDDLSRLDTLYLVHPWIDYLLDRQPVVRSTDTTSVQDSDDDVSSLSYTTPPIVQTRTARFIARFSRSFGGRPTTPVATDTASLLPPSSISSSEQQTRVLDFIARLRQPFGALLLTPTRRNVEEYRRVAADSLIRVQVQEVTPEILDKLIKGTKKLHVL